METSSNGNWTRADEKLLLDMIDQWVENEVKPQSKVEKQRLGLAAAGGHGPTRHSRSARRDSHG